MRIVLIEPSHWHFEMYRPGIVRAGAVVVGVIDRNPDIAARLAGDFGCQAWGDLASMLDSVKPDFAFAFGAHDQMPSIARSLVRRGVPFSMEKPGGIHSSDVRQMLKNARDAALYVSIPFHYRLSSLAQVLGALTPLPSPGFRHFKFFINAGSPLRYADTSPWLTDPERAGGGCMMNLAHHAIDFVAYSTSAPIHSIRAIISNTALGLGVEDQAHLHMTLGGGVTADIETGYSHVAAPGSYMGFHFEVSHTHFAAVRQGSGLAVTLAGSSTARMLPIDWHFKHYFAEYAHDTLARCHAGAPPVAGLGDLLTTVQAVEQAYACADATAGLERLTQLHRLPSTLTA